MSITKEDIKGMTMEERMALIDMIWEVTDEENPEWKDERDEDEILAGGDEPVSTEPATDKGSQES